MLGGDQSATDQDESLVTHAPKISRADAILDLQLDAEVVARTVNGLSPWPGCHMNVAGIDCKLLRAISSNGEGELGEILEDGTVAVGSGSVAITELQPAGSNPMSWKDFCNGHAVEMNDRCVVPS